MCLGHLKFILTELCALLELFTRLIGQLDATINVFVSAPLTLPYPRRCNLETFVSLKRQCKLWVGVSTVDRSVKTSLKYLRKSCAILGASVQFCT